jgi:hypothetical protein
MALAFRGKRHYCFGMSKISIEKLPRPEHYGDWHDKPLKWQVVVADKPEFRQKFSTVRDCRIYSRCVRLFGHLGFNAVSNAYGDAAI